MRLPCWNTRNRPWLWIGTQESRMRRIRTLSLAITSYSITAGLLAIGATSAVAETYPSSAGNLNVETVARGLDHPWSLAFLPDGRMLVTERPGRLRIVSKDGKLSLPVAGVPKVA